ncbi:hypothetical protein Lesp02_19580 [Lentzea sp. NBRC 105346]|uniref:3-oxoacyl-[acyl-carrier-protein] synthase III C-terminal domain-containing protein n=1 Tax=Lentzea sp. NBRC 105346 TaxID=3032205 RepID=UPI0024A513F3|nr:3-oxoacyl-[acyl-carrier-protein] synthase III C-terminal domain-containing protein [Lentzea sp. NBRC 105346]GLZ29768.1 hypothetical protein Lesp02_19580 [Lentzea sp. NBRC 105346]
MINPRLQAISAELPRPHFTTDELLAAADGHLTDQLTDMFGKLGVEKRHSVLANYPQVLFDGADPVLDAPSTQMAVTAARRVIASIDPDEIGLVLGVTSSPGRLLPSLVCDVFAMMPELPRDAANLSISYMGCSALAKVVETARWYLNANPGKRVLACFMEAITPLSPVLPGRYGHFTEESDRQRTVDAMHGFLFGDASVAMLLGADGDGPEFGEVENLTNALPSDAELGTVPDGGSDIPVVHGRRLYTLGPDVTARGTYYASTTVKSLIASGRTGLSSPGEASMLLLHTGSTRILDGLCAEFGVPNNGEQVASSYRVLRDYGNTIGCSVPLMLAEPVHRSAGEALLVAFGLSFSCGAFTLRVPAGGWDPS